MGEERFGRLLGRAAAPNLIVGRGDVGGKPLFDDGDEVLLEDAAKMPLEIVVADNTWPLALLTAICRQWGKEGVLEVAAPETRNKSRSLVLPEDVIDPVFTGLDGHMLNIYLSKGIELGKAMEGVSNGGPFDAVIQAFAPKSEIEDIVWFRG